MTDEVSAADEPGEHCRNCGLELRGQYCHGCSQDRAEASPSLLEWIAETVAEFTSLEGRSLQSIRSLLLDPGALTVAWREGQRVRYTRPLRLFLLALVLLVVLRSLLGSGEGFLASAVLGLIEGGSGPAARVDQAAVLNQADRILRGFTIALAPVVAGVVAVFFRGRSYSEHFVFTLHVVGFALLLRLAFSFVELVFTSEYVTQPLQILFILAYTFLALRRVYGQSAFRTALKLLAIATLSILIWAGAGAGIVALTVDSV